MSTYKVDSEQLAKDYDNLGLEQEQALQREMSTLQQEVASKLQELKSQVEAEITQEKKNKVNQFFAEKKAFFERYIEEVQEDEQDTDRTEE